MIINRLNGLGTNGVVEDSVDEYEVVVELDEVVVVNGSPPKQALSPEMQFVQLSSKVTQSDVRRQK